MQYCLSAEWISLFTMFYENLRPTLLSIYIIVVPAKELFMTQIARHPKRWPYEHLDESLDFSDSWTYVVNRAQSIPDIPKRLIIPGMEWEIPVADDEEIYIDKTRSFSIAYFLKLSHLSTDKCTSEHYHSQISALPNKPTASAFVEDWHWSSLCYFEVFILGKISHSHIHISQGDVSRFERYSMRERFGIQIF